MTITAPATTTPATIAAITDARLRAVVTAFVTVVEELESEDEAQSVEETWKELDDERDMVIAAAQAGIDALDELAATGGAGR